MQTNLELIEKERQQIFASVPVMKF